MPRRARARLPSSVVVQYRLDDREAAARRHLTVSRVLAEAIGGDGRFDGFDAGAGAVNYYCENVGDADAVVAAIVDGLRRRGQLAGAVIAIAQGGGEQWTVAWPADHAEPFALARVSAR
jgi:hypothetical protein